MWVSKTLYQRRFLIEGLMRAIIPAAQNQMKHTDQFLWRTLFGLQPDLTGHVYKFSNEWQTFELEHWLRHVSLDDSRQFIHCHNPALRAKTLPLRVYSFPTQRKNTYYVGNVGQGKIQGKCPEECWPRQIIKILCWCALIRMDEAQCALKIFMCTVSNYDMLNL